MPTARASPAATARIRSIEVSLTCCSGSITDRHEVVLQDRRTRRGCLATGTARHRPRADVRPLPVVCRAMKSVQPEVFLVARPEIDYAAMADYLREVAGEGWLERLDRGDLADAENLAEFAGKICYRAWEPGLNPNVRRVRTDHQ